MRKCLITLLIICLISFANYSKQSSDDRQEIPCQEIEIRHGRLFGNDWHYTINNQKEYKNIIGGKSDIDFTKYTLLGIKTVSSGCQPPDVSHSIYFDKKNDTYQYELTIRQNGSCKMANHVERWCLISKLSVGSKIEFRKTVVLNEQ